MVKKSVMSLVVMGFLGVGLVGAKTLATVTFPAPQDTPTKGKHHRKHKQVAAKPEVVNITESNFDVLKQRSPNFDFDKLKPEQKEALIEQAINNLLIEREARREKLDETPEFAKMVESYKKQLLVETWAKHQAEVIGKEDIPEAKLKQYYEANKAQFVQQEAHARHILVKTEAEAKRVISELNKVPKARVEKEFIDIANRESIDPNTKNSKNGGDLGKFQKNQMAPEFSNAVFVLKPGTYTKTPVKTEYGYHVIYLISKNEPKTPSYEKARQTIIGILKEHQFQEYVKGELEKLRKHVQINISKD
ncbi:peptidylprolyl isomerase [Helicobacter heilmannii]|nr:peptidyl-prolyl cis-trans isomerase [Helicobacter heilmannii]CRF47199.1 putative peptidyl-prolyl cis-trans isomerase [Helicobacter heilmannii]CRF49485.1 putative peptidyl-prolyl cis-trans isomerase [Helicobacter heilmannii]CRF50202.1 putative peptidyl-prolyl cis-trans isomerase [Helicobacter heilmannii]BDQ26784.1 putative peptidyl-prolyl cis-trans isomerase [Helicobacter heilmannii]GMB94560.1 Putative peptidyl-prolyl cis-trans isomerase PpiC [Helicobacter heilmannii]